MTLFSLKFSIYNVIIIKYKLSLKILQVHSHQIFPNYLTTFVSSNYESFLMIVLLYSGKCFFFIVALVLHSFILFQLL